MIDPDTWPEAADFFARFDVHRHADEPRLLSAHGRRHHGDDASKPCVDRAGADGKSLRIEV